MVRLYGCHQRWLVVVDNIGDSSETAAIYQRIAIKQRINSNNNKTQNERTNQIRGIQCPGVQSDGTRLVFADVCDIRLYGGTQ